VTLQAVLVFLQALQVVFLWIHDWVPLGRFNDVRAVRAEDSTHRLIVVTLIQSAPFTLVLALSAVYFGAPYPRWLTILLWVSYAVLLIGQLRAWWVPYLLRPEPARAARYRSMFGRTHTFLPERNGLVPNTAHVFLHICTAATLATLLGL
jgi:hypothetical protein